MMPMMSWFGGFYGLFATLAVIILVAAVLTVVSRPDRRTDDGEQLLRMRYASGEIDTEEYRKRLTALRADSGAPR
jgi:uncharacterized membrane protein